jgi:hypothetical protein
LKLPSVRFDQALETTMATTKKQRQEFPSEKEKALSRKRRENNRGGNAQS